MSPSDIREERRQVTRLCFEVLRFALERLRFLSRDTGCRACTRSPGGNVPPPASQQVPVAAGRPTPILTTSTPSFFSPPPLYIENIAFFKTRYSETDIGTLQV
ncbi:hypothetical protein EYF80_014274 [Liparis tanakae]|uniref:Uncharacterized protein n=1 Tax=Liparis tanakae TaxID=230148 RepID=A0A4Z2IDS5_9TELE|nr:hypothetical protein EYF80_014274 [Liparis tanakae]